MDYEDEPDYDAEWASALGLTLLDELPVSMIECLLVVGSLPHSSVDLNLDDLAAELRTAQRSAQEAYQAASLLNQRASLDTAWGSAHSRPRAVFARHNAAVRSGAPRVSPVATQTERVEDLLSKEPATDHPDDAVRLNEVRHALGIGISADWLRRRKDMSRWYHESEVIAGVTP
ncbi:hypothetical protein P5V78_24220 [Mycobacteroides abscessus subsp. abscessus]|uniref:hypothetical protein n=1 Tax=Mycobacteroides TaxID=670516 RepID=UPI0008A9360C|nr:MULTISPECIES: hypothetical protein [Mycobacteroides]AYM44313.1 hypothetical protein DYE20_24700 [[Mycobacterium] chelonae subsp. gwanakae]MDO3091102.1 hypothetical protein [Mycobacteroides abscessus subsp. abscessus]OHU15657.1 hypothetical protein BKG75_11230 [Mycobacteroides chelonae]